MSDDYLPLLLANMQQAMVELRLRVEALEDQVASLSDPEEGGRYLDGSPV